MFSRGTAALFEATRRPVVQARHAPGFIYTSPELFAAEKEEIFLRDWLCVGREEEIPNKGDYMALRILDEPLLIVRGENGEINAFSNICAHRGVEIVTGVMIPPDAKTFLTQAKQQGFKPKVVTLGKALLFPGAIEALGDLGNGLTTEVWWSPSHPYKSSLTGQSAKALADAYEKATKKQWTQPIGFAHALFEVAADVLKRSKDTSSKAVRDALAATSLSTVVGGVKWGGQGPFKNVSKTPLVLGQWVKGKKHKYELVIVNNQAAPKIPAGGKMKLI